jgi:hypothetical protein
VINTGKDEGKNDEREDMDELFEKMVEDICNRPGMYLGCPSVVRIRAFLDGYCHAADLLMAQSSSRSIMAQFRDWVYQSFAIKESLGWEAVLFNHAGNDHDGFYLFVAEWRRFCEHVKEQK